MNETRPIVIVGGTGKTGARVDKLLQARGIATRPVSRSSPIPFDWTRRETWAPALEGASKAYVAYQPDLAVDGADEDIVELSRLAREQGMEQIVLLSGRGEPGAQRAEAALQSSGITWTNVRASWFNQNFSEGPFLDGILAGELALPAGPVPEPFIDADDIADVVVAALTDERHANRLYEVTGPRAITFAEAMDEIGSAAGRPIHYRQISTEAFVAQMQPYVPQAILSLLVELFTVVLDGRNVEVMHGVEDALGRTPVDFADYARRTAVTRIWKARS
ncbi:NmrA family transcriptional regulator [Nitratireductor sp. ZSWI3]|uniref:NmrA family NAD(P)-binding protein n=1 Tax=Nitratireductor sp. ZSWI3 TaxID=2966359 RepID=UPI00214FA550|nr:NmrA family transcriptional regulator [Nitratireductor sp. ZSWI3]MCR4266655.1 NmrA family transcriptional regulator [Nitratireductor sp. ZSWI3]